MAHLGKSTYWEHADSDIDSLLQSQSHGPQFGLTVASYLGFKTNDAGLGLIE